MTTVYTIGHSTRTLDEFLALLAEHGIEALVDVRRFPASRRHPHFTGGRLAAALAAAGVGYAHEEALGGRRRPRPASPNDAWTAAGFRGYADHMDTPAFRDALDRLLHRAGAARTVIMCAEAVPWRCHRQLIADALVVRGVEVRHILGPGRAEPHRLNPVARVLGDGRIEYPARATDQGELFQGGAGGSPAPDGA